MNLREIRAKRDAHLNTARNIIQKAESEGRPMTEAEVRDFKGLEAKVADLNGTLECGSKLGEMRADLERSIGPIVPGGDGNGMAYVPRNTNPGEVRAYKPNEAISESRWQGPGLGAYIRGCATGNWSGAEELRALAEGSTPGSYLVPTPLAGYAIDLVRNQAQVMRAGALTIPLESQTLKVARLTTDVQANWKSENSAITFSDANFDTVTFTAQMLVAGSKFSIELFEDSLPNIDTLVTNSITKSLALALDYAALYGSGTAPQPRGVRNQSGVTVVDLGTNGYTLVDYSKFSAAISTLMGANFQGPFSAIYSARTAGELDNLQDTLHQPLRQPDLVAAMRKFVSNQVPNNLTKGSANTASDAFVGAFDNLMIGMRTGMVMEISRVAADSSGSAFTNAQCWVRSYLRADVQLAHPTAFVCLNGLL
jgi:HK97 family phage major capsid protein